MLPMAAADVAVAERPEVAELSAQVLHDRHKAECLRPSEWSETVRCRYGLSGPSALSEQLAAFNADLLIAGKRHVSAGSYRLHFRNWMNRRAAIAAASSSAQPPHTSLPYVQSNPSVPQLSGDALHRVRMAEIAEFQRRHLARLAAGAS